MKVTAGALKKCIPNQQTIFKPGDVKFLSSYSPRISFNRSIGNLLCSAWNKKPHGNVTAPLAGMPLGFVLSLTAMADMLVG